MRTTASALSCQPVFLVFLTILPLNISYQAPEPTVLMPCLAAVPVAAVPA